MSTRLTVAPGATVPHSVPFSAGSTMSFASTVARNGGGTGDGGGRAGDPGGAGLLLSVLDACQACAACNSNSGGAHTVQNLAIEPRHSLPVGE